MQPPCMGSTVTVLIIDGGGIRGLIPTTILVYLESQLQVYQSLLKPSSLDISYQNVCFGSVSVKLIVFLLSQ